MKTSAIFAAVLLGGALSSAVAAGAGDAHLRDEYLAAARDFVERSDRYLHHGRLKAGMKGYGLTVMSGTEIVRFEAEIVSVMTNWGPHQDVIIARLAGQGLEKSGIIAGMSGSPVYINDGGKDKLIGAVAYGWPSQKEPLCGIQPITQMIAAGRIVEPARKTPSPPATTTVPVEAVKAAADGGGAKTIEPSAEYLSTVLNPRKADFSRFAWPLRTAGEAKADQPELVPLGLPLMISSRDKNTLGLATRLFGDTGFVPVQSGGAGDEIKAKSNAKLQPGAAISVVLATGDADWNGVGTVTEVIGDKVLAMGHAVMGGGESEMPMGTAYVHAVVAGVARSFKLASPLDITGALERDENTAVCGLSGKKTEMFPVSVEINWPDEDRKETFNFQVCRHHRYAAALLRMLTTDALGSRRGMPEQHTVEYEVAVDFGRFGHYRAANTFSGDDGDGAISDMLRPVAALAINPFGKPVLPESVKAKITVRKGSWSASLLNLKLDGEVYRPGETVTGTATIRPFRLERTTVPVRFTIPDDMPEGRHAVTLCDSQAATEAYLDENPHKFKPRTAGGLLEAIQRVVAVKADRLYIRFPLGRGGVAVADDELPDLPEGRASVIAEAGGLDTFKFSKTLVVEVPTEFIINGSASASFEVKSRPGQTILREQGK